MATAILDITQRGGRYWPVVGNCFAAGLPSNGQSNGTDTVATYKIRHDVCGAASGLRLVFANIYGDNGAEKPGTSDITVKASLLVDSVYHKVFFNGRRAAVIEPGAIVVSDPVGLDLTPGSTMYSLTSVRVPTTGARWPLGVVTQPSQGEGAVLGQDFVDAGNIPTAFTQAFSPAMILGNPDGVRGRGMLVIGDSIPYGQGPNWLGYVRQALSELSQPYVSIAQCAGRLTSASNRGLLNGMPTRLALMNCATYDTAWVHFGSNDLALDGDTAEAVIADLTRCVARLKSLGVRRIGMGTLLPRTDAGNTAPHASMAPSGAGFVVNEAIRAKLPGVDHVVDLFAAVGDMATGLWKNSGYSVDGAHPSSAGSAALVAAFKAAVPEIRAF